MAGDLGLEPVDPLAELGPLAPDVLEAVGDVLDRLLDARAPVPEEAASHLQVPHFHRCQGHLTPPCQRTLSMSAFTSIRRMYSEKIAAIGDRSSGPSGGITRRNSRR